ncbi:hypothetical protein KY289_003967 [Solanum tuberosum]|nr:hypothetical protein KY289_003967 [Solanum tuberosum]
MVRSQTSRGYNKLTQTQKSTVRWKNSEAYKMKERRLENGSVKEKEKQWGGKREEEECGTHR